MERGGRGGAGGGPPRAGAQARGEAAAGAGAAGRAPGERSTGAGRHGLDCARPARLRLDAATRGRAQDGGGPLCQHQGRPLSRAKVSAGAGGAGARGVSHRGLADSARQVPAARGALAAARGDAGGGGGLHRLRQLFLPGAAVSRRGPHGTLAARLHAPATGAAASACCARRAALWLLPRRLQRPQPKGAEPHRLGRLC